MGQVSPRLGGVRRGLGSNRSAHGHRGGCSKACRLPPVPQPSKVADWLPALHLVGPSHYLGNLPRIKCLSCMYQLKPSIGGHLSRVCRPVRLKMEVVGASAAAPSTACPAKWQQGCPPLLLACSLPGPFTRAAAALQTSAADIAPAAREGAMQCSPTLPSEGTCRLRQCS